MNDDFELDSIDKHIIAALSQEGRLSYEELGSKVGLSASATLRRVRRLEDAGVLAGYVALVRARAIGLTRFLDLAQTLLINQILQRH